MRKIPVSKAVLKPLDEKATKIFKKELDGAILNTEIIVQGKEKLKNLKENSNKNSYVHANENKIKKSIINCNSKYKTAMKKLSSS